MLVWDKRLQPFKPAFSKVEVVFKTGLTVLSMKPGETKNLELRTLVSLCNCTGWFENL